MAPGGIHALLETFEVKEMKESGQLKVKARVAPVVEGFVRGDMTTIITLTRELYSQRPVKEGEWLHRRRRPARAVGFTPRADFFIQRLLNLQGMRPWEVAVYEYETEHRLPEEFLAVEDDAAGANADANGFYTNPTRRQAAGAAQGGRDRD